MNYLVGVIIKTVHSNGKHTLELDARFKDVFKSINFEVENFTYNNDLIVGNLPGFITCNITKEGIIKEVLAFNPSTKILTNEEVNKLIKINNEKIKLIEVMSIKTFPIPDDLYIDEVIWKYVNSTLDNGEYPLLIGPKGGGKTSTFYAVAKQRGWDFFPMNCGAIDKPKQTLIGQTHAKEGNTFLVESEFLKYFTSDKPTLIFLDEVSRIKTNAANHFITILDELQSYIYIDELGERRYKGKNVIFCAAANFGYEYTDTRSLDGAFLDRFMKFVINYLPQNDEIELISKRVPKADIKDITQLVKYATLIRDNVEELKTGISTRQLIKLSKYLGQGYTLNSVLENVMYSIFYNGSSDDRETIKNMINGIS